MCITDLFAALFFILLVAWGLVILAAAVSFGGLSVCLLGNINICGLIPDIPYWCGVILAFAFTALTVLLAVGCAYYAAFLRQLARSFCRFQHNVLANSGGEAVLPPIAINPQFSAKTKRRLRSAALISLILFAVCFMLAYIACSLSSGLVQFWHIWNWFAK